MAHSHHYERAAIGLTPRHLRTLGVPRVMLHLQGSGQSGKVSKTDNFLNVIAAVGGKRAEGGDQICLRRGEHHASAK